MLFLLFFALFSVQKTCCHSKFERFDEFFDEKAQFFEIFQSSHGFSKNSQRYRNRIFSALDSRYDDDLVSFFHHSRLHPEVDFEHAHLNDNPGTRLYMTLLRNYSVDVLPVASTDQAVNVKMLLKLTQFVDVDEKNQIMSTNVWLRHEWHDSGLMWDPKAFGGLEVINMPAEDIWLPDTVLYNNADGDYHLTIQTKVEVRYDGSVVWEPPAVYKSFCAINVEYFPYDTQICELKFGPWTYDVSKVDYFLVGPDGNTSDTQEIAIDMQGFYESTEWDLIHVHAVRTVYHYPCCEERFVDITYEFNIRRKTLFYTVNLILPCLMIAILTVLVFYLPCGSNQKMAFSISTLLALTWYILLLSEIIPPTSLALPLIGKYLLFTMALVTFSISTSVAVLYSHFRHPYCYEIPPCIRYLCLDLLPRVLCFFSEKDPQEEHEIQETLRRNRKINAKVAKATVNASTAILMAESWIYHENASGEYVGMARLKRPRSGTSSGTRTCSSLPSFRQIQTERMTRKSDSLKRKRSPDYFRKKKHKSTSSSSSAKTLSANLELQMELIAEALPEILPYVQFKSVRRAIKSVQYIAERYNHVKKESLLKDDWQAVARVLDRLLLVVFTFVSITGTIVILLWAPSLYDKTPALRTSHVNELVDVFGHLNDVK